MKQKVIPLFSAICMILCAGCTEDTAQSKQLPSSSDTQQTVIDVVLYRLWKKKLMTVKLAVAAAFGCLITILFNLSDACCFVVQSAPDYYNAPIYSMQTFQNCTWEQSQQIPTAVHFFSIVPTD